MEHRKLSGAKETMSARRNLEGNGGSKIRAPPSFSPHSGQKNTHNEPSKTHPNQARHQVRTISYAALNRTTTLECRIYENCIRHLSSQRPSCNELQNRPSFEKLNPELQNLPTSSEYLFGEKAENFSHESISSHPQTYEMKPTLAGLGSMKPPVYLPLNHKTSENHGHTIKNPPSKRSPCQELERSL
ncbi:Uncharacterized protein Rs2_36755 [Raphanus sativus]|nr:Uncharacterized protein Rs2_36755 [Raphanus sativus]